VISRLLGTDDARDPATTDAATPFAPEMREDAALVIIPANIDALLAAKPDEALAWRLRLRETLTQAFAAGFVITGFRPAIGDGDPAYLLERRRASHD
jgi:predicted GNAT superfamily acetyltransferase